MVSQKYRWVILLISSYYFYISWKPENIIFITLSTLVSYFIAIIISKSAFNRKKYLAVGVSFNLILLIGLKYFNFFSNSFRNFFQLFTIKFDSVFLNIVAVLGISFFTFKAISYLVDVYTKKYEPEKNIGKFALYISFFPQLMAGPIERADRFFNQLKKQKQNIQINIIKGLKIMLWGFLLKLVIADRLAITVNQIYNNIDNYQGSPLILGTYFFAFQIYCDFAGYSYIAIGAAKILGLDLMNNFLRPYLSKSIPEFWKRWHISLSSWFRDYLYIPLGGNRVKVGRWTLNIIIVFLVSGLWHGASWTFVIWGFIHGIYMIIHKLISKFKMKIIKNENNEIKNSFLKLLRIFITFHLILLAWIFFRANSVGDSIYIIKNIFVNITSTFQDIFLIIPRESILLIGALLFLVFIFQVIQERKGVINLLNKTPILFRWSLYIAIIFIILLFGQFAKNPFIYQQF
ncbi:MAG: MBOAT family O-acyltransferase [Patescibacteria group bacterium]